MIQILPLANILHEEVLLEDDFNNKFEGWEIIEDEDEHSFIKDSHYWMENKSSNRWMFYHKKLPVTTKENFIIRAEIEVLNNKRGFGQYGLVWGFDKEHNELNKFVVSSDHDDYTIAKFQKNHEFTRHRFNRNYEKHPFENNKQFFSIVKLDDYYYFFLNRFDRPEYMTHVSQMRMEGERFGFYVEPGIMIRCDKIVVKRLITDKNFNGNPWMPLDDDEMPFGSEILRG
jgi:hypothetical protein